MDSEIWLFMTGERQVYHHGNGAGGLSGSAGAAPTFRRQRSRQAGTDGPADRQRMAPNGPRVPRRPR